MANPQEGVRFPNESPGYRASRDQLLHAEIELRRKLEDVAGLADVGGTNNLQNPQFSIHGGRTSDTRLQLDGVRLGNVLSPGEFSNFVPDQGATQEVAVDYGAISAELAFGGLRINLVPKEGGNTFKGALFATGVNSSWQSDN